MAIRSPLVLAVDDEPAILRLLELQLKAADFRVVTADSGTEALRVAEERRPDIVLLDVVMPGITGLETLRRLKERSSVPVILITAKDSDKDKVTGLTLGADDYIVKPFNFREVSSRIDAVLRRSHGMQQAESVLQAGELEIDIGKRIVTRKGELLNLTRTEWRLLHQLALNPGRVMLNVELLSKVWGPEYAGDLQYLRVWVSRLRRKLEEDPSHPRLIKTKQGIGYLLEVQPNSVRPAGVAVAS